MMHLVRHLTRAHLETRLAELTVARDRAVAAASRTPGSLALALVAREAHRAVELYRAALARKASDERAAKTLSARAL